MSASDSTPTTLRIGMFCAALLLTAGSSGKAHGRDAGSTGESGPTSVIRPQAEGEPEGNASPEASASARSSANSTRDMSTGDSPEQPIPVVPLQRQTVPDAERRNISPAGEIVALPLGGLLDRQVRAVDHGPLGRIVDVLAGVDGQVRAVVVDIGGFLGVGNRRVAIAWSLLAPDHSDPRRPITILAPSVVIRGAPEYNPASSMTQILNGPHVALPPADEGNGKRPDSSDNPMDETPAIQVKPLQKEGEQTEKEAAPSEPPAQTQVPASIHNR
ncbi:PRC-barrel domain-containing protein [Acetobacter fallax]|uniref:PRC-barrel domain-containing protein n=1 Tax=Acetobacter fallax TaxID=1737473 RepID=A0ABX0K3Y4_9PROT|nr:PRC-barrel domain-containing protein [Acetobacter fallax]NHO31036.1 hypothetical protein [Acetobacter fallax]NHO34593.1 hypothetical protein [Acetobacter fallax]